MSKAAAEATTGKTTVAPPAGMARVGSVANAPWFNFAVGNVLYGVLENCYSRPDERSKTGRSKFFQIRLKAPAMGRTGRGKEAKVKEFPEGTVMNLNYGPKTKEFESFIPDILRGAEYDVWAHVEGEKFDIGKGQTMWPIDVRATMTRPPMTTAATTTGTREFRCRGRCNYARATGTMGPTCCASKRQWPKTTVMERSGVRRPAPRSETWLEVSSTYPRLTLAERAQPRRSS
jgi:hypothetical protein